MQVNEARIRELETKLKLENWQPATFLELIILRSRLTPENRAAIYEQAVKSIERDERIYGSTPQLRATRTELQTARRLILAGQPDIIDVEIEGVNPSLLDESTVKELNFPDKQLYLDLEEELSKKDFEFGSFSERSAARAALKTKARFAP